MSLASTDTPVADGATTRIAPAVRTPSPEALPQPCRRCGAIVCRCTERACSKLSQYVLPTGITLVALVLFTAYSLILRQHLPEFAWWDQVVIAVLVLGTAIAMRWMAQRRQARFAMSLGEHLRTVRDHPSMMRPHFIFDGVDGNGLNDLLDPLEAVTRNYRQALAELVQLQETVENLRARLQRVEPTERAGDAARLSAFPFERSRQQMVGRLTSNLRWQSATPMLQKVLGRSIEALNGRSFLRVVHQEDRSRVEHDLLHTLKDGESHNIVFRVLPPAETRLATQTDAPAPERYLQTDVLVTFDGQGRPLQMRCHFVDVTERVQTEKELRRRTNELIEANERLKKSNRDLERLKESYRDLYHFAPVMYFSLDEHERIAAVNESMLRALGHTREALMGQPYTMLLPAEDREDYQRDGNTLQRTGETEARWVGADGKVRDVWVGTVTILDPQGKVIRSRCAATDISERNVLAAAVVNRNRELEQANDRLRQINQELEEFTYVVSHDLKEPLRTLEAFGSFLAADYGDKLDAEGRDYINHLTAASRRLGALIDDLLTLSRAGRVINTPRLLDWDAILGTVLADLQLLITRRPGAVIRIEGTLPVVQGDPERIGQLLANLISNAVKYNDRLRPEVVIGALAGDTDTAFATLYVKDNGMGIDPKYHDQIFRIFRRLHGRDEYEGTGAGLAICKKVVEAHAGRIWVDSAPGCGATFFFTLPRAAGPAAAIGRPREEDHATALVAAG